MSEKLRYVGASSTTFTDPRVGEVSPGDEFTVGDDLVDAFIAREDVIPVEETGDETVDVSAEKTLTRRQRAVTVASSGEEPVADVTTDAS